LSFFSPPTLLPSFIFSQDTAPALRRESPDVYGAIPNTGRGLAFVTMFALSTVHVISKTLSTALLLVTNPIWLLYYMSGDVLFYLLQKVIRRDFIYWLPLPLAGSLPLSILVRIIAKVVADFSGSLHFRNPYECGGADFSFNLLMTQVSVPFCVSLYTAHYDDDANKLELTKTTAIAVTLVGLWLLIFSFFIFYVIVPEYRKTFWSLQTGWEKSLSYFLDNEGNDERRIHVFDDNAYNWRSIKEDVKAWTLASWPIWEAEQPEWFTPILKAKIMDDYIPLEFVTALGGVNRVRRGSASLSVIQKVELIPLIAGIRRVWGGSRRLIVR
jgi:hypothetical protein